MEIKWFIYKNGLYMQRVPLLLDQNLNKGCQQFFQFHDDDHKSEIYAFGIEKKTVKYSFIYS